MNETGILRGDFMKVQIIEELKYWKLEEKINEILSRHSSSEIFDIKYTGSGNSPAYSADCYSAMIIFK